MGVRLGVRLGRRFSRESTQLFMGWVNPWVGLGWVEIFQFLVGWVWLGPGPYFEGGYGFNPREMLRRKFLAM